MRTDMYKVIVERPRTGKGWIAKGARRRVDFDGPPRAGMRAGMGRPHLNENLSPLKRYLQKQVGRPWDKVWSEIASNIDRRNTVQQHIYEHIDQFIAVQVAWKDSALINLREQGRVYWWSDLSLRQALFVDPRTGLIRKNPDHGGWRRRAREKAAAGAIETAKRRRPVGGGRWHLLLEGEWFEVTLAPLPGIEIVEDQVDGRIRRRRRAPRAFDVVLKQHISRDDVGSDTRTKALYGADSLYATSKRQLSKREIEKFGLPR